MSDIHNTHNNMSGELGGSAGAGAGVVTSVSPPADPHAHHSDEHAHPTWSTYWKVAVILTVITIVEVWVYYIPSFVASRMFVPSLLIMSAVKFAIVVMFYMHLKYDHKLFRSLFTGPLIIAVVTLIALMFLFGKMGVTGATN